jgi:ABC-type methionine transport system permease subunit
MFAVRSCLLVRQIISRYDANSFYRCLRLARYRRTPIFKIKFTIIKSNVTVRAMGGRLFTIIRELLIPEALPGLISGFVVTLVTLIGASAMAGVVGAGGLGDLAIRYGYDEFQTNVVVAVVVILIALVWII